MPRMPKLAFVILPLTGIAGAAFAQAYDLPATGAGWRQVDFAEDGDCQADVRGNGMVYQINVVGLEPGSVAELYLTNDGIKPIARSFRADGNGAYQNYYQPLISNQHRGTVTIGIAGSDCRMELSFPWKRGVPVIGSAGERTIEATDDWPQPLGS